MKILEFKELDCIILISKAKNLNCTVPLVSVMFFSDGKDKTHGLVHVRATDLAFHILIPNL